jgi:hypothetical protein
MLICMLSASCQTRTRQDWQPALLVEPTPQAEAEVTTAIVSLLGHTPATIDARVFESTSRLSFAPAAGPPAATGRVVEMPIQIELVSNGEDCALTLGTERRSLRLARCRLLAEPLQ